MPDTITVSTQGTESTDDYGNTTYASPETITVKGRWRKLRGNESLVAGGLAAIGDVVVDVPAQTVISEESTLVVAARGGEPEHTFAVKAVLNQTDETVRPVLCTEG